jgi:hypothetical protein
MAADLRNGTPAPRPHPAPRRQALRRQRKLLELRQAQLQDYSDRLKEATITRRPEDVAQGLRRALGLVEPTAATT